MKKIDLAIFDMDNTLYDWYAAFLPAFYAMVDEAAGLLHCNKDELLRQLKAVHVKHHDVEHPYGLFETDVVQSLVKTEGSEKVWRLLDPAFHAFNRVRKNELRLFPRVRETLDELRCRNIRLVAFTDSKYFSAVGRLARLDLGDVFQKVYCRAKSVSELPGSPFPGYKAQPIHNISAGKVSELPVDEVKPDPRVLRDIVEGECANVASTAYIGDSLAKDVVMARRAGCFAIWAKYGVATDQEMYAKLIRISHWSDEDIVHEKRLAQDAASVAPDFVCEKSIDEILSILNDPAITRDNRSESFSR